MFHEREALLSSVDEKAKIDKKVTKTDVLANDISWLNQFYKILSDTNLLKFNKNQLNTMTKLMSELHVSALEAAERTQFFAVLLTERKFLVNLVKSMLSRLLIQNTLSSAGKRKQIPSFQNDPFLE